MIKIKITVTITVKFKKVNNFIKYNHTAEIWNNWS